MQLFSGFAGSSIFPDEFGAYIMVVRKCFVQMVCRGEYVI
jgi:hypothetical protein